MLHYFIQTGPVKIWAIEHACTLHILCTAAFINLCSMEIKSVSIFLSLFIYIYLKLFKPSYDKQLKGKKNFENKKFSNIQCFKNRPTGIMFSEISIFLLFLFLSEPTSPSLIIRFLFLNCKARDAPVCKGLLSCPIKQKSTNHSCSSGEGIKPTLSTVLRTLACHQL